MHTTAAPGSPYDVLHLVVTWEIHSKQR